jgi:hypothetical protein
MAAATQVITNSSEKGIHNVYSSDVNAFSIILRRNSNCRGKNASAVRLIGALPELYS